MKPPAFQFYADDFIGGTVDLSVADVGAYIRLLCYQWGRGSIPETTIACERVAGGPVSPEVLAKFPGRKNPRMERERVKQAEYRAAQVDNGRAGANARWGRHSTPNGGANGSAIVSPMANTMAKNSSPTPSPTPSPISVSATSDLAAKPPPARNPQIDALAEIEGTPKSAITKAVAVRLGTALKEIRASTPDVTADEIRRRAGHYPSHFDATLTAAAVAKWWGRLSEPGFRLSSETLGKRSSMAGRNP